MLPPLIDHHVHLHLIVGVEALADGIAGVVDLGGDRSTSCRRVGAVTDSPRRLRRRLPDGTRRLPGRAAVGACRQRARSRRRRAATAAGRCPAPPRPRSTSSTRSGHPSSRSPSTPTPGRCSIAPRSPPSSAAAREHGLPVVAHVEGEGMTRTRGRRGGRRARAHAVHRAARRRPHRARRRGGAAMDLDAVRDGLRVADARARAGARQPPPLPRRGRPRALRHRPRQRRPAARRQPGRARAAHRGGARGIRSHLDRSPTRGRAAPVPTGIATFVPGPPPAAIDDLPDWLATARVVPTEDLETL